jgi:C-terminal peptidase prc
MRHVKLIIFILFSSLLAGCSDSDNNGTLIPQAVDCSIPEQNQFVHELLQDRYLWYREVPASIDYADFDSPEQTLDFLKFEEKDRFSYIADAEEFSSLFGAGQYVGYGFAYFIDDGGRVWFKFVYNDSEAGRAGLERGDEILSINGETVEQISTALAWDTVFGDAKVGVPVSMLVRKKDGSTADIPMQKSLVNINTVLYSSVIEQNGAKVGYLIFNSFLSTSVEELDDVFAEFSAQGVSRVILDLRYNGGGSVSVARDLGSYLFDNESADQLFTVLEQNDKYRALDSEYFFTSKSNELDLQQLVIITTGSTASASEMIVNGLKPFVPVKTIGSKTYGKPVGMNGFEFCGKIILPITFAVYNADHQGDYFDGIAADCAAEDDVSFAFGDSADPMLAEALRATQGQGCSANKPAPGKTRSNQAAPVPSLQEIIGAV